MHFQRITVKFVTEIDNISFNRSKFHKKAITFTLSNCIDMIKEKEHSFTKADGKIQHSKQLILFNDDFNTFDFVIESLVDVCEHTPEQAETCAIIVHYNGKCAVKSGSRKALLPLFKTLSDRNLIVEID